MNPTLEKLVRLQRAESDLRRAEAELAEVPRLKSSLEERLAEERGRLDAAREGLAGSQKARRQHEADVQDLRSKCSKYKGQLMEVKTNKEYTAMLHEIETVEREIREREDQILAEMEKAEELSSAVKGAEADFKEAEARHRSEVTALDRRAQSLQEEVGRHSADRDVVAKDIPEDTLSLFHRVARLRGSGVAAVRDGICTVCRMKLRPQMYVDLKRNDDLMQCPACNRILFYEPPPPTVAPEP
jgi:predicted  nucleic acid-binding Zn-ribbon protein